MTDSVEEVSDERLVELLDRLDQGAMPLGMHSDNSTELFDVEGMADTMSDAARALRALSRRSIANTAGETVEMPKFRQWHWDAGHPGMTEHPNGAFVLVTDVAPYLHPPQHNDVRVTEAMVEAACEAHDPKPAGVGDTHHLKYTDKTRMRRALSAALKKAGA